MAGDQVTLHGAWPSPFSCRVKWALELKGIPYKYIEEDLQNKSQFVLKYNPVHKKIPVLVHEAKPVCESMIIVEYLDQIWPHEHPFLPKDPYKRALARFWVKYVEDKAESIWMIFRTTGEEQEKAKKSSLEMLRTIEEHAMIGDKKFFGGDEIGILDIAFGVVALWSKVIEQVSGVTLFEANEFPRLQAWLSELIQVPAINQNLPDRDAMLVYLKGVREKWIAKSKTNDE